MTQVGEYAVRGGLVDVFPLGGEMPVRIDMFGDEIEQLSYFQPGTQRTENQAEQVRLLPVSTHRAHLNKL